VFPCTLGLGDIENVSDVGDSGQDEKEDEDEDENDGNEDESEGHDG
jgi:hypothetical protein